MGGTGETGMTGGPEATGSTGNVESMGGTEVDGLMGMVLSTGGMRTTGSMEEPGPTEGIERAGTEIIEWVNSTGTGLTGVRSLGAGTSRGIGSPG